MPSVHGYLYFLTIIVEYCWYGHFYPMKSMGEACELFLNFITRFEKQSGHLVKSVHGYNGTDFYTVFKSLTKEVHIRMKWSRKTHSYCVTIESKKLTFTIECAFIVLQLCALTCQRMSKYTASQYNNENAFWNHVCKIIMWSASCKSFWLFDSVSTTNENVKHLQF